MTVLRSHYTQALCGQSNTENVASVSVTLMPNIFTAVHRCSRCFTLITAARSGVCRYGRLFYSARVF